MLACPAPECATDPDLKGEELRRAVGRSRWLNCGVGEEVRCGGGGGEEVSRVPTSGVAESAGLGCGLMEFKNIFSALMHDVGMSWSSFLAACE